jgi:hypothetical protein
MPNHRDRHLAFGAFRSRSARPDRRKTRVAVEPLEGRQVLSTASQLHALAEMTRAERIEFRVEHLHHTQPTGGQQGLGSTSTSVSPSVVPATTKSAAAAPLTVQWTYGGGNYTGDSAVGFLAFGMSQPINLATLNSANVQLSYQAFGSSKWIPVAASLQYNAGNRAVVIVPYNLLRKTPTGQPISTNAYPVLPNGTYVAAIYPGLNSTGGATVAGNQYLSFTLNTTWGSPGHYPITVFAPPGNASTIPNDPFNKPPGVGLAYSPGSGVIIADQYEQLMSASVNSNTIYLYHLNGSGAIVGAPIPLGITYNNQIPSIELAPKVALTAGNYRFIETNTVNFAGVKQTVPAIIDFNVPTNEAPAWDNTQGPIDVITTFPANNQSEGYTDVTSVIFTEPAVPSTINPSTIQLEQLVNGKWSAPLPGIAVNYNPGTYVAYLMPTNGLLSQGTTYRIVVNPTPIKNPIRGSNDVGVPNTMATTKYYNFTFLSPPSYEAPLINTAAFGVFPQAGTVTTNYPGAFIVSLAKFDGYRASSVNNQTFQIFAQGSSTPIPSSQVQVSFNPRAGYAVITLPFMTLGNGQYQIVGNPWDGRGAGLVDLVGNVQKIPYHSGFFGLSVR